MEFRAQPAKGCFLLVLACVVWVTGCSAPPYEIAQVEGVVTVDGTPLPQAVVEFHPNSLDGTEGPSSRGRTDAQGRYQLRYSTPESDGELEGVVVGEHRVRVLDLMAASDSAGGRIRYARKYTQLTTTPIRKQVQPGPQSIPIELTTR